MMSGRDDAKPMLTRRQFLVGTGAVAFLSGNTSEAGAQTAATESSAVPTNAAPSLGPGAVGITLTVNRRPHEVIVEPRVTLLDALRERIGLTGTKKGCDRGECGACTVHVNGRRILSCMTLAVMHTGDQITTIEGLAEADRLHAVQAAFIEHDAFQCGYCTSGQIMSAVALLAEIRDGEPSAATIDIAAPAAELSEPEIRERMSGNLCRCSCYPQIVAAIRQTGRAAAQSGGG